MSRNIFITGTGTDVGKTYVAALIVKKLQEYSGKAAYYKAAMSGNEKGPDGKLIPGDALYVKQISGIGQPLADMCPYIYEKAYSPHLASRLEGGPVEPERVKEGFEKLSDYTFVTMEGSGGILCPIRFDEKKLWLEDIIGELHLSCLLVAEAGLGTINEVGLTAAYMKERKIPVKGIILNHFHPGDILEEDNRKMCEFLTGIPVIACVKENDTELDIDVEKLARLYEK